MPSLTVTGISKAFRGRTALNGVSLEIHRGEVVGFVGPNGAGKTTTMKIMAGLLKPDSGSVTIGDMDLRRSPSEFLHHIGVLIDSPAFYPALSAYDHLAYLSRIRGPFRRDRVDAAVSLVGLDSTSRKRAGQYSTGMKQRLGIAMALLHEPDFLILDEPTNGLDPVVIVTIRKLIDTLARERNIGVLISSHLLHEIEQVCDRVLFIRGGKLVTERHIEAPAGDAFQLLLRTSNNERARDVLEQRGIISSAVITDDGLTCRCAADRVPDIAPTIVESNIGLLELRHHRETLEQVYLSKYEDDKEVLG